MLIEPARNGREGANPALPPQDPVAFARHRKMGLRIGSQQIIARILATAAFQRHFISGQDRQTAPAFGPLSAAATGVPHSRLTGFIETYDSCY